MEKYIVELEKCGEITQIPDSQKLFGCLMHTFSEFVGDELCGKLVSKIILKDIKFNLSNVIPSDCFPVPKDYILQNVKCKECVVANNNVCNQQGKCKKYYELLKKLKYAPKNIINEILSGNTKALTDTDKNVDIKNIYQQRVHIVNTPDTDKYIKSMPFSIQKLDINIDKFYFLFSIDITNDSDIHIKDKFIQMINELLTQKIKIVLGQRASQGLNLYKLINIKNLHLQNKSNCNLYLNMGMLLPDEINYDNSYLSLFTSDRRPYNTLGKYHKSDYDNIFISFIEQGSVISLLDDNFSNSSKCVYSNNKRKEIIFGNSFLYPIDMNKGVINIV